MRIVSPDLYGAAANSAMNVASFNALTNMLPERWYEYYAHVQLASLQNSLGRQSVQERAKSRRNSACQWFATKWRARASEIGVYGAARLMRKQGVPCDVAVSILATR